MGRIVAIAPRLLTPTSWRGVAVVVVAVPAVVAAFFEVLEVGEVLVEDRVVVSIVQIPK
jgi:hypothetical protein